MMQSSRKPPLPRSPINLRHRSRRPLQSAATNVQSPPPPVSLVKPLFSKPDSDMVEPEIRPEYRAISSELNALAKMVQQELGGGGDDGMNGNRSPIFERGRFYEEYSARRNEMLKRKKAAASSSGHCLGVRVESAIKKEPSSSKRFESLRKPVPCTPMAERVKPAAPDAAAPPPSTSRYLLRSRTATKKPPTYAGEMSSGTVLKKVTVRRGRKI